MLPGWLNPILTLATACSLLITSAVPASVLSACCCEWPSASPSSCCTTGSDAAACACCLPVTTEPVCCLHQAPAPADDQANASHPAGCTCDVCECIGPAELAPAIPPRGEPTVAVEHFAPLVLPALYLPAAQAADEVVREDFLLPLPERPARERFCVWVI